MDRLDKQLYLREIDADEVSLANDIVVPAIGTWGMKPRLQRLVIATYQYDPSDFQTMRLLLIERSDRTAVGMVALEDYPGAEVNISQRIVLLHGIYVMPAQQRQGVGQALVEAALAHARAEAMAGVLVKAHASANGFFRRVGFTELPVQNAGTDYPHRFWWPLQNSV